MRAHHAHVAIHTYKCTRVVLSYTCGGEGVAVHIHMHMCGAAIHIHMHTCAYTNTCSRRACGRGRVHTQTHAHDVDALECDQSVRLCVHSSDARARASVLVNFCLNN